jgi:hypothetical protein
MSPALQLAFVQHVIPIITATVPRTVTPVGAEDPEELIQDGIVLACRAAEELERRRKPVLLRSVAYYAIQRLKSGRRSYSAGRTDVMSPGCQLDGNAEVASLEEPVHVSDADDEYVTLGGVLASRKDDPAQAAVRNTDWSAFMTLLDGPQQYIVRATAEGQSVNDQAEHLKVSAPAVCSRRQTVARRARCFWGDSVLTDVQAQPLWRRQAEQR